jgi:hypothetical protein
VKGVGWPNDDHAETREWLVVAKIKEVDPMPVGMLLAGEVVTKDSYKQLTEKMFGSYPMPEDQSPEGLIIHSAGQSEQGWYVYDIWASQEDFQRFVESKLGPAIQALGVGGGSQPEPQFFPIETLVKGPAL